MSPNPDHITTLLAVLQGRDWTTASQLQARTGLNDRALRSAANASNGRVISGQNGYKLTAEATADEIDHATRWLCHQAKEMHTRAQQITRQHERSRDARDQMTLALT